MLAAPTKHPADGTNPIVTATDPDSPTQVPTGYTAPSNDGAGLATGKIKHVWVIVMENKSYDATFTGLNGNGYLWQTLPSQGALLTNYYGIGHSSQDNYLAMFSGQAPVDDIQDDCDEYRMSAGNIDTAGSVATNQDYGQYVSAAGPNAPVGDNGCVYPEADPDQSKDNPTNTVETLFNQLDAAGKSWKLYAQDFVPGAATDSTQTGRQTGTATCGAGLSTPGPVPSATDGNTTYPIVTSASPANQYISYHNPLPWFESVLQSGDCTSSHVGAVLGQYDSLSSDLAPGASTPSLSVIIPNDCSDAHDAACKGNNLSGGFGSGANSEIPNAPTNYAGGLYAGDLFLEHVIPEIEKSPAFADGGLIDVTFDEAYMPYTWQDSFQNSSLLPSTAFGSITTDSAGETLYGRSVNWEPSGPNVPIVRSNTGQVLDSGPGFGRNLDRPSSATAVPGATVACSNGTADPNGNDWIDAPTDGCLLGGASTTSTGSRTDSATVTSGSGTVQDNSISVKDQGRSVTISGDTADTYYVGNVKETYDPGISTASNVKPVTGSFQLLDVNGNQVSATLNATSVTLGGQTTATDPMYDAYDATTGGGDTGSVLISPYITPGTVSNTYYNHYSLLRTLEDVLGVNSSDQAAGTTLGGLDGEGHLGYADQPGLAPFGTDVFTNASLGESTPTTTVTQTVTQTQTKTQTQTQTETKTVGGQTLTTTVTKTKLVPKVQCVVPDVRGFKLPEARVVIRASQCKVGAIRGNKAGRVSTQSLRPGKHVNAGTSVAVKLTVKRGRGA